MNESESKHLDPETREALLVEYQAAQDSAQFHDGLLWTISSIMWGGSLVLLGFLSTNHGSVTSTLLFEVLASLGLLLNLSVWVIAWQLRRIKKHKYDRCKAIENEVGTLGQHKTLNHLRGMQMSLYSFITLLFCVAWVILFFWA